MYCLNRDAQNDMLYPMTQETVDEPNGTTVRIPITHDSVRVWHRAIIKTIPYFKGILYDCRIDAFSYEAFTFNETPIIEGKTFYYRNNTITPFHVCLDQVVYELNPHDFGLSFSYFPFGLKFSVSEGLRPLPARESLALTELTKEKIIQRLKDCINELREYFINSNQTLLEYFDNHKLLRFEILDNIVDYPADVMNTACNKLGIEKFIAAPDEFKDIPDLHHKKQYLLTPFVIRAEILSSKLNYRNWRIGNCINSNNISGTTLAPLSRYILYEEDFTPKQVRFLREEYNNCWLVKKTKQKLKGYNGYIRELDLNKVPKDKWRDIITSWQSEQDKLESKLKKWSDIVVEYDQWCIDNHVERKPYKRVKLTEGQFKIEVPSINARNKFKGNLEMWDFSEKKYFITVYFKGDEHETYLQDCYYLNAFHKNVKSIIVPEKIFDSFETFIYDNKVKNVLTFEEFKKHKIFKKQITIFHIRKYYDLKLSNFSFNQLKYRNCEILSNIDLNKNRYSWLSDPMTQFYRRFLFSGHYDEVLIKMFDTVYKQYEKYGFNKNAWKKELVIQIRTNRYENKIKQYKSKCEDLENQVKELNFKLLNCKND